MEFIELKRGDILFYDQFWAEGRLPGYVNHVALVQSHETPIPKVIHLLSAGIGLNEVSERRLDKEVFHAFRAREQGFAEKAATTAFNWLINNNYDDRRSKSKGNQVLIAPGIYNSWARRWSTFRFNDYGNGARSFVQRLCRECSHYPPLEFRGLSSFYDGAAFCSGFVISAYQTAIGEELCPTLLALDARNTMPLPFYKYLETNTFWTYIGKTEVRKEDT